MAIHSLRTIAALSALSLVACGGGGDTVGTESDSGPNKQVAGSASTVSALATSNLVGRKWAAGKILEASANNVVAFKAGIADTTGNVIVVFVQNNGSRNVLYATRGTPGTGTASSKLKCNTALKSTG